MQKKVSILVVDDEVMVCDIVQMVLLRAGYFVEKAYNGFDALTIVQEKQFDLILTDLVMPNMDGVELIGFIRNLDINIPIIAMTGGARVGSMDMTERAEKAGVAVTLKKPLQKSEIIGAIETTLSLKSVS